MSLISVDYIHVLGSHLTYHEVIAFSSLPGLGSSNPASHYSDFHGTMTPMFKASDHIVRQMCPVIPGTQRKGELEKETMPKSTAQE